MSEFAALIAQLTGPNQPSAQDPALAAVKLARASIDALVLKLGQTIDAKVVGQLAAGLTQLTVGNESFVLKLETPLPAGTAVSIKVAPTLQGTPVVTVSVPSAPPEVAQPMPVPTPTAPLVEAQGAPPAPATPQPAIPTMPHATQLPLPEPVTRQAVSATTPLPQALAQGQPVSSVPLPTSQSAVVAPQPAVPTPQPQPTTPIAPSAAVAQPVPSQPTPQSAQVAPSPLPLSVAQPQPAPGQPAAQVPLPVAPPSVPTVAVQPAAIPAAQLPVAVAAVVPAVPAPAAAATAQPAAMSSQPTPTPAAAGQPAPILATPLVAQPTQPLPTRPSPYPVHVPHAAAPVVAQQLPLAASSPATPRPAAPPLNLADPAQAAARQDSAAPLLAKLATIVTAAAPSLPRPVIEMALKLLANRLDLNRGAPDAKALEAAVLKAGVLLTPLAREAPTDSKSALLALRSTLLAFLGGDSAAPVATAERPAPPIKGEPPRAPAPQAGLPDPSADGHDTARTLLGHTDAALSRLKLLQSASQPVDVRIDAPAPRNELRVEIPMLLGAETGILQLMVERDGKHKREPERQRGWRMRFAMNFSATGEVGADIALLGRSASIAIWAADPDTADALGELLPELAPAIQRHGLELTSLRVRRGAPQAPRTAPGQLLDSAR
jgi:hypothetical protein